MELKDVRGIIHENFTMFFGCNAGFLTSLKKPWSYIRYYAAQLWHTRLEHEVERDEKLSITVFDYMKFCSEKFKELRPAALKEKEREALAIQVAYKEAQTFVSIWAAIDFKENPDIYNMPDSWERLEGLAHSLWIARNAQWVARDRKAGIIESDYVTWVTDEFHKGLKIRVC